MVKLEAHYINAGGTALAPTATVAIDGVAAAEANTYQRADFGLWGTKAIAIPPQATASTGVKFQAGAAGTTIFALTSFQHALGTRVQVWAGARGETSRVVLDAKTWWNPSLVALSPPLAEDGASGLSYQCDWTNTTTSQVGWGEDAASEVCFVGVYYAPSRGLDDCVDEQCAHR
jgi:hypothetical protein